jgi:hypothetical protein
MRVGSNMSRSCGLTESSHMTLAHDAGNITKSVLRFILRVLNAVALTVFIKLAYAVVCFRTVQVLARISTDNVFRGSNQVAKHA